MLLNSLSFSGPYIRMNGADFFLEFSARMKALMPGLFLYIIVVGGGVLAVPRYLGSTLCFTGFFGLLQSQGTDPGFASSS